MFTSGTEKNLSTNRPVGSKEFIPMTSWMPAVSIKLVKVLIQLVGPTSNFRAEAAYQVASVDPDVPGNVYVVGNSSIASQTKVCSGMQDISTNVDPNFFVRFGVNIYSSVTSDALERANVALVVSGREC